MEVLVLLPSVGRIERDALLDLPALEAVVVDVGSKSRPEDCDCGRECGAYRHVHVFRLDTTHPPMVSLPDTLFLADYPVPVLLHSEAAGAEVGVSDGRALTSTRGGYEVQTLRFPRGEFAVGDVDMWVAEWDEREGNVELRASYGKGLLGRTVLWGQEARSVRIPGP